MGSPVKGWSSKSTVGADRENCASPTSTRVESAVALAEVDSEDRRLTSSKSRIDKKRTFVDP